MNGKPGAEGSFWGLVQNTVVFESLHVVSWTKRHCASVLQAATCVHKPITQRFLSSLSNSVYRHKGNVLLLRSFTWYSIPVAGTWNLLNQTYILTANLKFATKPTYKIQVTHIKSTKFTSIPKFWTQTECQLVYLFPCITALYLISVYS